MKDGRDEEMMGDDNVWNTRSQLTAAAALAVSLRLQGLSTVWVSCWKDPVLLSCGLFSDSQSIYLGSDLVVYIFLRSTYFA